MTSDKALVIFLCLLIIFLLWHQSKQLRELKQREQYEKLIQLLQAYPVHQYTMSHMLERSLAIIFSPSTSILLPKAVVFLMQNEKPCFAAQRGLIDSLPENDPQAILYKDLLAVSPDIERFKFISNNDVTIRLDKESPSPYGHYIVPLIRHNIQIGLLMLYTPKNHKATNKEIKFIKSIGISISSLIERKQIADELNLASNALNLNHQSIFITDKNNIIIRCNKACERLTGYSSEELMGQTPNIFKSKLHNEAFYNKLWQQISEKGFWQGEIWNKRKDDTVFPEWLTISCIKDVEGQVTQYFAVFTDLTAIKKAENDIQYLSFYDALTQLPNRTLFNDQVEQSITQANRQNTQLALLCLDIDHFKKVNESLGHEEGDKLLQIFAERIRPILRKNDCLARIGGDEFAMLIHNFNEKNNSQVIQITEKILLSLKESVQLSGHNFIATASIGISLYPDNADNAVDLFKYADIAMFHVKQAGRNSYQFYTEKFNQQALKKISIESALRLALKENNFEVHLQGQYELNTQLLIGAEALLRVGSGELSKISPAEYIPVSEETGLIVDIGDWVFKEVCTRLCYWYENKILPVNFNRIAINISPVQFKHPEFISKIQQAITETRVPVHHLEIELTESSLQESTNAVIDKLLAIKGMGISIAIDDFGTGYSSLSRLKKFPIDLLKIDRSFVNDICTNHSDTAIVKAIIAMSNALDIDILAEGIEYKEQAYLLRSLNCQYGQGFLFNKPLNSKQFETQVLLAQTQAQQKIAV